MPVRMHLAQLGNDVEAFLIFARMKNITVLPPSRVLLSGARNSNDSLTSIEIKCHFSSSLLFQCRDDDGARPRQ